jgi:hypothetical protein
LDLDLARTTAHSLASPMKSTRGFAFDLDLYEQRVRSASCFICAIVAGDAYRG